MYTVVIPCYNASLTIVRAVNSCLNQTLPPGQIIIIDDASTDDSISVIKHAYSDNAIVTLIAQNVNKGVSSAKNIGIDNASNAIVAFLDSDDSWLPEKMELCIKFMHEKSCASMFHDYYLASGTNNEYLEVKYKRPIVHFHHLLLRSGLTTCSFIINKDIIKDKFDEQLRYMEDWDYYLKITTRYPIYHFNKVLSIVHRPHNSKGGLSGNTIQMRLAEMSIYLKMYQYNFKYIVLTPALLLFSMFKHLRKYFKN